MAQTPGKMEHSQKTPATRLLVQDASASDRSIESYRGELLLHCYRLLGSLHDAEDAVQETMLRAWRHTDTFTFKGAGALRSWLYTIATNVSLDALKKRPARTLPIAAFPAADQAFPAASPNTETLWLEPLPESWLTEVAEDPEARYTRAESVSLAFLTALHLLPPRQRAILLLADVLDWRASEIAQLLELSVSAVNSALHRARTTLEKNYRVEQREEARFQITNAETSALLARYLRAWENDDVDGLVALLKEDATLSMPPVPSWYQGPAAIRAFLTSKVFPSDVSKRWRLCPVRANDQYAFALYSLDEATGIYQARGIQVVTLAGQSQIAAITAFMSPELMSPFGFPSRLSQGEQAV